MDKSWTEEKTKEFIKLRTRHANLFTGKKNTAQMRYKEILAEMNFDVTPKQAAAKWQNLTAKYKEVKNPPTGKGVEEEDTTALNWKYFEDLDKYFSSKHIISPELIISSTPTSQNECLIHTQNTPNDLILYEDSCSEWNLSAIQASVGYIKKVADTSTKKRKNPFAFLDAASASKRINTTPLVDTIPTPVDIATPPKKSAAMKAKEATDAKIDKLIDLSKEGNAILARGVTALERYLEFKMNK